jgi:hypothetical protein
MILRVLLCGLLLGASLACRAFTLFPPVPVVEYYNVFLGHYFMTEDIAEMAGIDAGKAGPGWVRTGYAFKACPLIPAPCYGQHASAVSRFYGTPGLGPNSHFYTADAAEAAGLDRPGTGWSFEKIAFHTGVPDGNGQCASGTTPVYRLYNRRAIFNDSNHRYVTSAAERARMVAKGWADEGVRFCSDEAVEVPIKRFAIENRPVEGFVHPSAQCEDETFNLGPCIAVNNLPAPGSLLKTPTLPQDAPFFERTGYQADEVHVLDAAQGASTASDVFVQGRAVQEIGIHIDTRSRGPNAGSSINPLYQLSTTVAPGQPDLRFFPFGAYESDVQLAVSFNVFVKTIQVRSAGGSAFGHTTLELIDQRSGKHVYFTTLAYGTIDAVPVFVAFDTGTGRPIVGTSMRADSPYIRPFGLPSLPTPSGFVSPHPWGWGGEFEFRVDRAEFKRIIDSWRTLVPELSTDPADYFFDTIHFNNEIGGDGEIGIWLRDYQVQLVRR